MKLAYLSSAAIPSTSAHSLQVMKMCQALADEGAVVILFAPPGQAELPREELERAYGVRLRFEIRRVRQMPVIGRRGLAPIAVRAARAFGCDAIYTRGVDFAWWSAAAGLPTLLEVHQPPTGHLGRLCFGGFVPLARGRLAVISRQLEEKLRREYPLLRGRSLLVLPDAVDLDLYQNLPTPPVARERLHMASMANTIGYFGSLVAGRGLELILALARRFPEAAFLICGGEPSAVQAWRSRSADCRNIHWTGHLPNAEVPLYQAACDVLLMPYERRVTVQGVGDTSETMSPLKLFEYMASGRLILASDLPALREMLNGNNCMLLPPDDTGSWESALRNALSDPPLRLRLAAQACTDVAPYSWRNRARAVLDFAFGDKP
jgi:glycosyltransferase involved in cell wall biosynthesis